MKECLRQGGLVAVTGTLIRVGPTTSPVLIPKELIGSMSPKRARLWHGTAVAQLTSRCKTMGALLNNVLSNEHSMSHFLILSRDTELAKSIQATLRRGNYRSTIVRNPRQATLAILSHRDIEAVICDARLRFGREEEKAFYQLRQDLIGLSIPLVLLVDPQDELHWHRANQWATDEFVATPADEEELLVRMKGVLWRKQMQASPHRRTPSPDLLQGFIHYVTNDLETRFETHSVATLTLLEAQGAWDLLMAEDDRCDSLTNHLLELLADHLQREDRLAHHGRVTLAVYMPGHDVDQVHGVLESLSATFQRMIGVGLCAGLVSFPQHGSSYSELILAAEHALAQARTDGSMRVADQPTNQQPQADRRKILIADDDPYLGALLEATFKALGYQTIVADNGRTAIDLIQTNPPDLVILDHLMPGLTGFELLEQLREQAGDRQLPVPVIMLTMMTAQTDIVRGYSLGVEDYVGKPFNPHELIARVERVLGMR
ncbi:MAG: response regulator [Acidobacteriota bacterium]|nr:response regulator [Blastocatellia bacterium]MDW8238967.1 response regulator [Acidobacteriota bacterium]